MAFVEGAIAELLEVAASNIFCVCHAAVINLATSTQQRHFLSTAPGTYFKAFAF